MQNEAERMSQNGTLLVQMFASTCFAYNCCNVEDYNDCCSDPLLMHALDTNTQHFMHHILQ